EGAENHYRHSEGGNQRGAEILQEQVHHQEHQRDGFHQRVHHPSDGFGDYRRRFERINDLDTRREERLQVFNCLLDRPGGFQRVGAGGQLNGDTGGRLAVVQRTEVGILCPELDPRHVTQTDLGAGGLDLEQNGAELLRCLETGLADDGCVELLPRHRRRAPELATGYLHVLCGNGVAHVNRSQVEAVEFGRIQPDAHGIGRTEYLEVTDSVGPGNRVLDRGHDKVRQVLVAHAAVGGDQAHHHQEVG